MAISNLIIFQRRCNDRATDGVGGARGVMTGEGGREGGGVAGSSAGRRCTRTQLQRAGQAAGPGREETGTRA